MGLSGAGVGTAGREQPAESAHETSTLRVKSRLQEAGPRPMNTSSEELLGFDGSCLKSPLWSGPRPSLLGSKDTGSSDPLWVWGLLWAGPDGIGLCP